MHHPYFKASPQTPLSQLRSALPERDALEYRSPLVSRTYRITDSPKPACLTRRHCTSSWKRQVQQLAFNP